MTPNDKRKIVALLDANRIMSIATNRPDGWPQVTIVGYANDGLKLYCMIAREGQKWTNIARDPRVSIAIGSDTNDPMAITGLSLAGHAEEVRDAAEIDRLETVMLARYPEYASMPIPGPDQMVRLRVTPDVVSVLDYSKGFGHSDLVAIQPADLAA